MPERKYKGFRIDCEEIQGEGAYLHLARPSWVHIKEAQEAGKDGDFFDIALGIIGSLGDDWNWVDDEGNPLPPPSDDVIRALPLQEQNFLVNKFNELTKEKEKN